MDRAEGPRWRSLILVAVTASVVLGVSVMVSMPITSTSPPASDTATFPPLVLRGELVRHVPWNELPTTVRWDGRKDPDNRHKDLQALFQGETLHELVGLVDDNDPETFDVAKAKRGYTIRFVARDGYEHEMDSREIIGQTTWIVARLKDGEPLPEREGPYRNVGPFVGFLASPSVKQLIRIELEF